MGILLLPTGRARRKLPNLVDPNPIRNVKPTQSDQRIAEYSEATRQNTGVTRRPVTSNRGDTVAKRIITEHTTSRALRGEVRTAYAIDIVRSAVVQYTASHVIRIGIRVNG